MKTNGRRTVRRFKIEKDGLIYVWQFRHVKLRQELIVAEEFLDASIMTIDEEKEQIIRPVGSRR